MQDFAYETTFSGHVHKDLEEMRAHGYEVELWFPFLADPRDCVARVRQRAAEGGHGVPDVDVLRRHQRGLENSDGIGERVATRWRLIDSWTTSAIATGTATEVQVANASLWREYEIAVGRATTQQQARGRAAAIVASHRTTLDALREEAERDFTRMRETLRRRYERMGGPILRRSDVARVLESDAHRHGNDPPHKGSD